jgi:hypothetical protein
MPLHLVRSDGSVLPARLFAVAPVLMKVLAFQLSANLLEINLKVYISFDVAQFSH